MSVRQPATGSPSLDSDQPVRSDALSQIFTAKQGGQVLGRDRGFLRALFRAEASGSNQPSLAGVFSAPARKIPWLLASFVFFVVIPSIATFVYFAALAAPQYATEARLIVRAADTGGSAAGSLGAAVASLGSSLSYSPTAQNSYVVAQYIRSRAAVDDLKPIIDLRVMFSRPEADFLAKLKEDASEEELVEYWRRMVRAYVDGPSSIVSLEVRAFRPEDALEIAQAILTVSEHLVNQMSRRAREDVMRNSEEEVRRADTVVRSALDDLQKARDVEGMLDPVKAADETGKLLAQLMGEKIRMEAELHFATRSLDKTAPTVRQLTAKLEIVDSQILALKSSLAGTNGDSSTVASAMRKFEQLEVQRFLADKLFGIAEEGLERARAKAERQNLYLMVFVPPYLPMTAMFPRRLAYSIFISVGCLIFWGIAALVWAAIEDHRN